MKSISKYFRKTTIFTTKLSYLTIDLGLISVLKMVTKWYIPLLESFLTIESQLTALLRISESRWMEVEMDSSSDNSKYTWGIVKSATKDSLTMKSSSCQDIGTMKHKQGLTYLSPLPHLLSLQETQKNWKVLFSLL